MQQLDGMPQDKRGIYRGEGHSMAWFTDPAGNRLSVVKLAAGYVRRIRDGIRTTPDVQSASRNYSAIKFAC